MALDAGTGMLGNAFGLFARVRKPQAVVLLSNMLDADAVLAIDSQVYIMMSESDWNPWQSFAEAACKTHRAAYNSAAAYYVLPGQVDRKLISDGELPAAASAMLTDWLQDLCRPSPLT
jgi:hypothetical protein